MGHEVEVKKVGEKYRVVLKGTGEIAKTASGAPLDSGGGKTRAEAVHKTNINTGRIEGA